MPDRKHDPRYALSVDWEGMVKQKPHGMAIARAVLEATRAVRDGTADADQQKLFWDALRKIYCAEHDPIYRSDADGGARVQENLIGRRSVWLQLVRATENTFEQLAGENSK